MYHKAGELFNKTQKSVKNSKVHLLAATYISDGDELEHDVAEYNNKTGWYRFVSEESGAFCFESFNDPDEVGNTACALYDANSDTRYWSVDGVHPTAAGHQIIKEELSKAIVSML